MNTLKLTIKYALIFWAIQWAFFLGSNIYFAAKLNLWPVLASPALCAEYVRMFISIPMWLVLLAAGLGSVIIPRFWLLVFVVQAVWNIYTIQQGAVAWNLSGLSHYFGKL